MGPFLGAALAPLHLRAPLYVMCAIEVVYFGFGWFTVQAPQTPARKLADPCRSDSTPSILRSVFLHRVVGGITFSVLISSFAQRGLESLFVVYTHFRYAWNLTESGIALGVIGVTNLLVQGLFAHPLIQRHGAKFTALAGALLLSLGFLGLSLAQSTWQVYFALGIGTLGGLAGPALQTIVTGIVRAEEQGRIQGVFTALVNMACVLAPMAFASVLFPWCTQNMTVSTFAGFPFLVGSFLVAVSLTVLWSSLPSEQVGERT